MIGKLRGIARLVFTDVVTGKQREMTFENTFTNHAYNIMNQSRSSSGESYVYDDTYTYFEDCRPYLSPTSTAAADLDDFVITDAFAIGQNHPTLSLFNVASWDSPTFFVEYRHFFGFTGAVRNFQTVGLVKSGSGNNNYSGTFNAITRLLSPSVISQGINENIDFFYRIISDDSVGDPDGSQYCTFYKRAAVAFLCSRDSDTNFLTNVHFGMFKTVDQSIFPYSFYGYVGEQAVTNTDRPPHWANGNSSQINWNVSNANQNEFHSEEVLTTGASTTAMAGKAWRSNQRLPIINSGLTNFAFYVWPYFAGKSTTIPRMYTVIGDEGLDPNGIFKTIFSHSDDGQSPYYNAAFLANSSLRPVFSGSASADFLEIPHLIRSEVFISGGDGVGAVKYAIQPTPGTREGFFFHTMSGNPYFNGQMGPGTQVLSSGSYDGFGYFGTYRHGIDGNFATELGNRPVVGCEKYEGHWWLGYRNLENPALPGTFDKAGLEIRNMMDGTYYEYSSDTIVGFTPDEILGVVPYPQYDSILVCCMNGLWELDVTNKAAPTFIQHITGEKVKWAQFNDNGANLYAMLDTRFSEAGDGFVADLTPGGGWGGSATTANIYRFYLDPTTNVLRVLYEYLINIGYQNLSTTNTAFVSGSVIEYRRTQMADVHWMNNENGVMIKCQDNTSGGSWRCYALRLDDGLETFVDITAIDTTSSSEHTWLYYIRDLDLVTYISGQSGMEVIAYHINSTWTAGQIAYRHSPTGNWNRTFPGYGVEEYEHGLVFGPDFGFWNPFFQFIDEVGGTTATNTRDLVSPNILNPLCHKIYAYDSIGMSWDAEDWVWDNTANAAAGGWVNNSIGTLAAKTIQVDTVEALPGVGGAGQTFSVDWEELNAGNPQDLVLNQWYSQVVYEGYFKDNVSTIANTRMSFYYKKLVENSAVNFVVPGGAVYTVDEAPGGASPDADWAALNTQNFNYNLSISGYGTPATIVTVAPGVNEIQPSFTGTLTFNAADVGKTVTGSYRYASNG